MWKAVASNALTLLIVASFLLGGIVLWGKSQYSDAGPLAEAICVRVPSGGNMSTLSRDLEERGAVSSGAIFRIGADYSDKTDALKAGSFLVPAGASMESIVDIVTRGGANTCGSEIVYRIGVTRSTVELRELDPATATYVERAEFVPGTDEQPAEIATAMQDSGMRYRVLVAEGVTSWQVVDSLKRFSPMTGEVSAVPAEGTLAPFSYEIRKGDDRFDLLVRMQERQKTILAAAWESRAADLPFDTPEEALVLASIIEKETGVPEERGTVASVFVNRLREGMRLQTDPTVIYGITKGEGVLGRGIRQSELRAETPYNTYVITGLPPTPIANPGAASIEAAVNPPETDFRFFVADGSGGHAFSRTLEEHNANVAKWRQIEAERATQSSGN
ncbi:endolytic transglycosylase MltG [Pseudooceanicola nanhaiensis]|uniref:endolytic transglycosylase MltG n=1 Tax=Pseudooceanicola nanhaiensis TaxID=375761 RepID=UPI001CD4C437|nr:endolytic transglycosylase MltG [Pseudooceanicola nanhaiensis]MCA0922899.1 endolytic transglycosylase MltG [Pseudooceanicola nanhaiensis]